MEVWELEEFHLRLHRRFDNILRWQFDRVNTSKSQLIYIISKERLRSQLNAQLTQLYNQFTEQIEKEFGE